MQNTRLGLTFHRTFFLVRSAVSEILSAVALNGSISVKSGRENITDNTNLGSIYIEAMPRYAIGSGLLKSLNSLSAFGNIAFQNDHLLDHINTQWLMHYHLSAPLGPGPAFWHELVSTRFRSGDEFTTQEITDQISEFFEQEEGKSLAPRSARSTATIFLGTYLRSEGLGNLGLLKEISPERFRIQDPEPPSTWVIAFSLLHWWRSLFNDQVTLNLNDLYGDQGLTNLLMIGKGRLNTVLEEMQEEGFIELYRTAPPYQIVLLRNEEEVILRKIYGS